MKKMNVNVNPYSFPYPMCSFFAHGHMGYGNEYGFTFTFMFYPYIHNAIITNTHSVPIRLPQPTTTNYKTDSSILLTSL